MLGKATLARQTCYLKAKQKDFKEFTVPAEAIKTWEPAERPQQDLTFYTMTLRNTLIETDCLAQGDTITNEDLVISAIYGKSYMLALSEKDEKHTWHCATKMNRGAKDAKAVRLSPLRCCPALACTLRCLDLELNWRCAWQITMFKFHREVDKFAWPFKARKFDSVRDGAAADGAAAAAASAPVDATGTSPPAPGAAAPAAPPGSVVSSDKIRWMKQQREHKRKMNDAMSTALEKVTTETSFCGLCFSTELTCPEWSPTPSIAPLARGSARLLVCLIHF